MMPVKKETISLAARHETAARFSLAAGAADQVFNTVTRRGASPCWAPGPNKFCGWGNSSGGGRARFPDMDSPAAGPAPAGFSEKTEFGSRKDRTVYENHRKLY